MMPRYAGREVGDGTYLAFRARLQDMAGEPFDRGSTLAAAQIAPMSTSERPTAGAADAQGTAFASGSRRRTIGPSAGSWRERHSSLLSTSLLVLGGLLLFFGVIFAWARVTIFDSDGFADAATESLRDEAVQDRLATELTDRIVANDPERARLRPLILGATAAIIDSTQFATIFTAAVERLHDRVMDGESNDLLLELGEAIPRIRELIAQVDPELAARIPPDAGSGVVSLAESDYRARLARLSERVEILAVVLPVLAIVAFTGSLLVAQDHTAAAFSLGMALAVTAALVLVALVVGAVVLRESVRPVNESAADGIWWSFTDSLRTTMRVVAIVGLVAAATAWWIGQGTRSRGPAAAEPGAQSSPPPL